MKKFSYTNENYHHIINKNEKHLNVLYEKKKKNVDEIDIKDRSIQKNDRKSKKTRTNIVLLRRWQHLRLCSFYEWSQKIYNKKCLMIGSSYLGLYNRIFIAKKSSKIFNINLILHSIIKVKNNIVKINNLHSVFCLKRWGLANALSLFSS